MSEICPKCQKIGDFERTCIGSLTPGYDPNYFICPCGHRWRVQPDAREFLYTSIAKNVKAGLPVTIRKQKVVLLRPGKKPGARVGVWTDPEYMVFLGSDGQEIHVNSPGGFQVRGACRMQAAIPQDSYYGIPLKWDAHPGEARAQRDKRGQ